MINAAAFAAAHAQHPEAPVPVDTQAAASPTTISATEFLAACVHHSGAWESASAQADTPPATINAAEFVAAHYQNDPDAPQFTQSVGPAQRMADSWALAKTSYPAKRLSLQNGHYHVVDYDK